jgi:hypothetical protein
MVRVEIVLSEAVLVLVLDRNPPRPAATPPVEGISRTTDEDDDDKCGSPEGWYSAEANRRLTNDKVFPLVIPT